MNRFSNLTKFLLNFALLKNFLKTLGNWNKKIQDRFAKIKPFSWETMLFLSLMSWCVLLLVQGQGVKHFVSIFAWGFLIIATDWGLMGKKLTIPLIGFQFQYAPWITGAFACAAFFSNDFLIRDWRSALISYPGFVALSTNYTKFIRPGMRWGIPDPGERQDLVLSVLLCGLLSSWVQFHFLIQDVTAQYPNLLADDFDRSAFINRLNPAGRARNRAYALLEATEITIRRELAGKNWLEAQNWLQNVDQIEPELSRLVVSQTYGEQLPKEQNLWQITADPSLTSTNPPRIELKLQAKWLGPSSSRDGLTLQQVCQISPALAAVPQTRQEFQIQEQAGGSYEFVCQPPPTEQSSQQSSQQPSSEPVLNEQLPGGQLPGGQLPGGQLPTGQLPTGQLPGEQPSSGQ